ncbi:MAG: DUF2207 domain-containing protein [Bacteroidetes bacterium]|jgi:uncharacterized protein (TIGR04222 family)|nr:DUF2207 domain-containing protein [Bacteroidota bacterium]
MIRLRLLTILFVIGCMSGFSPSAAGQSPDPDRKEYAFSNYDVTIHLRPDGALDVRETLRLDVIAGTFSSMYREVEMSNLDSLGHVSVMGAETSVDSLSVARSDGDLMLRWQYPERSEPASFDISYRAYGALRSEDGMNMLKWTAIGTEIDVPVSDVDVTLMLPSEIAIPRDSLSLTPEPEAVRSSGGGWSISFAKDSLDAGTGYSVEATFPERFNAPERFDGRDVLKGLAFALVTFFAFLGAYLIRRRRNPPPEVMARTPQMPPYEAARMLGEYRASRMHGAMVFDLARRGHLTLRADKSESWLSSTTTITVEVHPDESDLRPFEETFLNELSKHDTLDKMRSDMSTFRQEQRTEVRKALVERGWLFDRSRPYLQASALAVGTLALTIGVIGWAIVQHVPAAVYVVGPLIGVSIGSLFFIGSRYAPTEEGRRLRAQINAFIDKAKSDIESLSDSDPERAAEQFPELLPWLLLSDDVSASWIEEQGEKIEASGVEDVLPAWLRQTGGSPEATLFVVYVAAITSTGDAGGAVAASTAGGVAGAGAGGAGGGGAGAS